MAQFNIFEGSRRVALLIKVLWVAAVLFIAYSQSPSVSITFATMHPTGPFEISDSDCEVGSDGIEYKTLSLPDGRSIFGTLCFKSMWFESTQKRLVPYKTGEGGTVWGNDRYSNDVMNYQRARAEGFVFTPAMREAAEKEWSKTRTKNIQNTFLFVVGGWIVLSIIQFGIGWIVRGFMGIPRGKDRRAQPVDQQAST